MADKQEHKSHAHESKSHAHEHKPHAHEKKSHEHEHESHSHSHSRVLTDHDEIRKWAEAREAQPAEVIHTGSGGEAGVLRLNFPGYSGEHRLKNISWEEFFQKFDEKHLALLVQDETASGKPSNFSKLISRH